MQITEVNVFHFGKLQNRSFSFSPGLNVIYGENEAGKSTLQEFMMAMLFGMEKGRGRASENDRYSRYEPWHAPSFYSGAMRFSVGNRPFYLERNFYHKEKRDFLRNEADGEELSVAYGDLAMLLGGIDKEMFGNTYYIPQSGAVTKAAMTQLLSEYYANTVNGWEGHVPVLKAVEALQNRKKELAAERRRETEVREEKLNQRRLEQELLQQEYRKLNATREEFEKEQQYLKERRQPENTVRKDSQETAGSKSRTKKIKRSSLLAGAGGAAVVFAVSRFFLLQKNLVSVFAAVCFLLIWIAGLLLRKNEENDTCIPAAETGDEAWKLERETLQHAENMLAQLRDNLQEKENRLLNIEMEIEQLQEASQRERELTTDMEALEMAAAELNRLSKAYYEEKEDEWNGEISRWVSLFTAGKYDSIRMEKDGKLLVLAEGQEVSPQALSRGTLEQMYLALRMAVGSIMMQEEKLPVFLDEAFGMYDDVRLAETLKALARTDRQIFILTCQKREKTLLKEMGITYHEIEIS